MSGKDGLVVFEGGQGSRKEMSVSQFFWNESQGEQERVHLGLMAECEREMS